jgi:alkanesulfonate monooxygenase SsuD/methylene tetrahydromethanopterin reductase-like flavin-dependent oxidoreductase (luciferase family)
VAEGRRAEALGFDFVSASDHLHGEAPTWEPWTMLAWIGAATSRIGLATRVLGLPYRRPAVVAKMAESFDRLSGGRLILGLGAGAFNAEFRAFGLGDPSPRDKVDGLEEAVLITRGLWSEPRFTFEGRLHRTDRAELAPKPDRAIPIWLGTYGDRALAVTGRLADGWIPSLGYAGPEQVTVMREKVLAAAEAAGREPGAIRCVYNVVVRVDEGAAQEPTLVAGGAEAVAERLLGFLGLGFSGLNLMPSGPGPDEQVERLAKEVLPVLRRA